MQLVLSIKTERNQQFAIECQNPHVRLFSYNVNTAVSPERDKLIDGV